MSYAPHSQTAQPLVPNRDTATTGSDLTVGSVLLGVVLLAAVLFAAVHRLLPDRREGR